MKAMLKKSQTQSLGSAGLGGVGSSGRAKKPADLDDHGKEIA
jgi:hypothetical protein